MGVSLSVKGFSDKNNKDFIKHYKAVKFCIENDLSFPAETSEFFKGKVDGGDLDDYDKEDILDYIENGVEIELPIKDLDYEQHLKVSDIPAGVDLIIIKIC